MVLFFCSVVYRYKWVDNITVVCYSSDLAKQGSHFLKIITENSVHSPEKYEAALEKIGGTSFLVVASCTFSHGKRAEDYGSARSLRQACGGCGKSGKGLLFSDYVFCGVRDYVFLGFRVSDVF